MYGLLTSAREMSIRYLPGLSVFLVVLMFVPGCSETIRDEGVGEPKISEIKKDCSGCHISRKMKGALLLKKPISELCDGCHPERKSPDEHLVDVVPSMEVEGLPLTEGRITCITCHDPHKNPYGKLLRARIKDLCLICHKY